MSLNQLASEPDRIDSLTVEDLALLILEELARHEQSRNKGQLHRGNFSSGYKDRCSEAAIKAMMEAWMWLEHEGLIAPQQHTNRDWVFVTRAGHEALKSVDTSIYLKGRLLPADKLHPSMPTSVRAAFLRSEYDVAVLQAFKQVEIAVRDASGASADKIGVALMREAFKPGTGPLSITSSLEAEQIAIAHLFAGAIGLYKNPHSHRDVEVQDPMEATEMISIASHLLRIVDTRRAK